jgi:hypothetical protein
MDCNLQLLMHITGYAVVQLVEALCYKLEGRGFETDEIIEFFQFTSSFQLY